MICCLRVTFSEVTLSARLHRLKLRFKQTTEGLLTTAERAMETCSTTGIMTTERELHNLKVEGRSEDWKGDY